VKEEPERMCGVQWRSWQNIWKKLVTEEDNEPQNHITHFLHFRYKLNLFHNQIQ
jgi:hypothetical protein